MVAHCFSPFPLELFGMKGFRWLRTRANGSTGARTELSPDGLPRGWAEKWEPDVLALFHLVCLG